MRRGPRLRRFVITCETCKTAWPTSKRTTRFCETCRLEHMREYSRQYQRKKAKGVKVERRPVRERDGYEYIFLDGNRMDWEKMPQAIIDRHLAELGYYET